MTNNEIDIIGKKYYLYIDTSTIIGKMERLVADMLNINSYKHGKNGIFLNSKNKPYKDSALKLTWKYDKYNKRVLRYTFFLKIFNKYIELGDSRYDILYIDKNLNIHGKGYSFNKNTFDFYLYTKPTLTPFTSASRLNKKNAPIGILDSGVGGLTVTRAIIDKLPNESIIYIADKARSPYGPRPVKEIRRFVIEIMDYLVYQGVKAIVIASNTSSVAAYAIARKRYNIQVIEVIEPAIDVASKKTHNKKIGVIGTTATINSNIFPKKFYAADPTLKITSAACPLFVDYIERGETDGEEITKIAREYLEPIIKAKVDTLLLACTHYPLLKDVISKVMGKSVTLVDSNEKTAMNLRKVLNKNNMRAHLSSVYTFLSTGTDLDNFKLLSQRFLGSEVKKVEFLEL
jgi:glutamate racemase